MVGPLDVRLTSLCPSARLRPTCRSLTYTGHLSACIRADEVLADEGSAPGAVKSSAMVPLKPLNHYLTRPPGHILQPHSGLPVSLPQFPFFQVSLLSLSHVPLVSQEVTSLPRPPLSNHVRPLPVLCYPLPPSIDAHRVVESLFSFPAPLTPRFRWLPCVWCSGVIFLLPLAWLRGAVAGHHSARSSALFYMVRKPLLHHADSIA